MAPPPAKKIRTSSPSRSNDKDPSAQNTTGNWSQDSSGEESEAIPENGAIRSRHTTLQAKINRPTSWNSDKYDLNIFKLKANELLAKARPDYERRIGQVEKSLRNLKHIIERISDRESKPVCSVVFCFYQVCEMSDFRIDSRSGTRTASLPWTSNPISRAPTRRGRKVYICLLQACEHQCRRQLCTQDSHTSGGQIEGRSGGHYAIGETPGLPLLVVSRF